MPDKRRARVRLVRGPFLRLQNPEVLLAADLFCVAGGLSPVSSGVSRNQSLSRMSRDEVFLTTVIG